MPCIVVALRGEVVEDRLAALAVLGREEADKAIAARAI
jgi:hypothetical protein